jgi:2-oxoacid:acceptor oxidoreductase delta subunit (pyruvate/2-ketoisovalerate family)
MKHPYAIALDVGTSKLNLTGTWRTQRPIYVDRLPPCNAACPAGEDIQGWLSQAEEGDYEASWRTLTKDNPLPAVMGRVCYHPCETSCNRAEIDEPVGINSVERFLGDVAIAKGWAFDLPKVETGKRVLVVGAGPAGLSAAYHLRRFGYGVTIREAGPLAGGMMRFGIPKYRLPRDVLGAEVRRITQMGVELILEAKVDDIESAMREGGYHAAFLAVGAHIARRAYIPAGGAAKILDAVSLLRSMEGEAPPLLGRKVVIYGGGNTALDAARTARRLGADEAIIVYRRTREKMPAHDFELEEALQEGVSMKWLSTIKSVGGGSMTIEKMKLDTTGFPQPTGEFETLEADSLVLALGQDVDLSLLEHAPGIAIEKGVVKVGPDMMTGRAGVFAGGDMSPSERTVTVAVGHGKKAARCVDAYLRGGSYVASGKHALASFDRLNPWYCEDARATVRPVLEALRRVENFEEVVGGLDETNALYEARRCLSCGNCFECDNCYGVCPDNAVIKLGPGKRFKFDYDYCKGCGLCAQECPCGAIEMVAEEI